MANNKIKTKVVYRIDGLEDIYSDNSALKYKFAEFSYNEKGDILQEREYDSDGNNIYLLENKYDENNRLQQLECFYDTALTEKRLFTYNNDGLIISENIIYTDAGEKQITYTYNESNKLLIKTTADFSEEEPFIEEQYEYDNDQRLIRYSIYHNKNTEAIYWRTINYTPEGKIIEETTYDAASGITYVINDNLTLGYSNKKLVSRATRTFNEKEQLIAEITEDNNGKRIYNYHYDDTGNVVMEERLLRNNIYFKVVSQYKEQDLLQQQTVIDPERGSYTEFYDYIFSE